MDIKLQLRYMQNFAEEISSTLKVGLDEPYRNKIREIMNNTEITDVEKVRQMYSLVQEGHGLISKTSNIDPIHMARANSLKVIVDAVTDSLMDRSTIKNVRDVINANNYEAVNVDASVTTNKGITQAGNFLDAVVSSVRPDHEMYESLKEIKAILGRPEVKSIISYNFPDFDPSKFLELSELRQQENQTLNVGVALANQINAEYNKMHPDFIGILSMLKRQSEKTNGILNDTEKKSINNILNKNLPPQQQANVDLIYEGYNEWYQGVTAYLMQGYNSNKIDRQRKNKTGLFAETTLNMFTYEAKLKRILDPNEEVYKESILYDYEKKLNTFLNSASKPTQYKDLFACLGPLPSNVKQTLQKFIKNNVLLNAMENSNQIHPERRGNKEIIEALKFQMKEQLEILHDYGVTSFYPKIGECVNVISEKYFKKVGLTPVDDKDNIKLYNDSIFDSVMSIAATGDVMKYSKLRYTSAYEKAIAKLAKKHGRKISDYNAYKKLAPADGVPEEDDESRISLKKDLESANDLSDEALEIRARKKKDPRPPKPPQKAKDKLISIYLIQEIMSEKGVTSDGVKDVNTFLNCAQTRIQELMVEFQTLAAAETGGDPVKLAEICEEAFVEYKSIDANKLKVKQDMADTTANVGIKKPAHIKRRDNAKKIEVANSASSAGAMEWNQGEIKYQLVSSGGKDVVQYNFTTSSDIANIPHFAKVMLYSKILNPASLSGTSLMTNIQAEIGSEASYVISGIPTTTIPSI